MQKVRLAVLVCVWIGGIGVMTASQAVAQTASSNGVTRQEIQQLQEQISAMQKQLNDLLARVESNGYPDTPAAVTPVALTTVAAPAQTAGQIPGQRVGGGVGGYDAGDGGPRQFHPPERSPELTSS